MKMILTLLIMISIISVGSTQRLPNINIEKYLWKNRLLVLQSPHAENPSYQKQLNTLKGLSEAFAERKLTVIHFVNDQVAIQKYNDFDAPLHWKSASSYRIHLNESEDYKFNWFLIGLDGGVKKEGTKPIAMPDVFAIIDGMPMRQAEMRRRKDK